MRSSDYWKGVEVRTGWRDEEADVNDARRREPGAPSITESQVESLRRAGETAQKRADELLETPFFSQVNTRRKSLVANSPSPSDILDRCKQIAQSKSHDYTTDGVLDGPGRFENFDRAQLIAGWFRSDVDKPYAVLIGVKLARLATLLSAKEPQNESIEDTFVDLTNYCALWGSRRSLK